MAAFVADTRFSVDRGIFDDPFLVEITTETGGAEIWYTIDGARPSPGHGAAYREPILIDGTTILRAAAFKPGLGPTNVDTQTYLFPRDIVGQSVMLSDITLQGLGVGTTTVKSCRPNLRTIMNENRRVEDDSTDENITIRRFKIDNNGRFAEAPHDPEARLPPVSQYSHGIDARFIHNLRVEDMHVYNCSGDCIYLKGGVYNTVERVLLDDFQRQGIAITSGEHYVLRDIRACYTDDWCVDLEPNPEQGDTITDLLLDGFRGIGPEHSANPQGATKVDIYKVGGYLKEDGAVTDITFNNIIANRIWFHGRGSVTRLRGDNWSVSPVDDEPGDNERGISIMQANGANLSNLAVQAPQLSDTAVRCVIRGSQMTISNVYVHGPGLPQSDGENRAKAKKIRNSCAMSVIGNAGRGEQGRGLALSNVVIDSCGRWGLVLGNWKGAAVSNITIEDNNDPTGAGLYLSSNHAHARMEEVCLANVRISGAGNAKSAIKFSASSGGGFDDIVVAAACGDYTGPRIDHHGVDPFRFQFRPLQDPVRAVTANVLLDLLDTRQRLTNAGPPVGHRDFVQ